MTKEMWFEVIGYAGSLLVLVSMLMTSVVKLRVINLIGSAIFTVYALLIRSYPTALMNVCLVGINLYHLIRQSRTKGKTYQIQAFGAGEGFPEWFFHKHEEDIRKYFSGIDAETAKNAEGFAVFYDDQAAGLLLGTREEGAFRILIDYTTPAFRDCSVGAYLYSRLPEFGILSLCCRSEAAEHVKYMKKMGFSRNEDGAYVKTLN